MFEPRKRVVDVNGHVHCEKCFGRKRLLGQKMDMAAKDKSTSVGCPSVQVRFRIASRTIASMPPLCCVFASRIAQAMTSVPKMTSFLSSSAWTSGLFHLSLTLDLNGAALVE